MIKTIRIGSAMVMILFGLFGMVSCSDVEPIDPAVLLNPNPNPNPNPDPQNPDSTGVSAGNYWPSALNNQWVFTRNGVEQPPLKIVSVNSINNKIYYTFNEQSGTSFGGATGSAETRIRKDGANYYLRVEEMTTPAANGVPGATTTGSEWIILRDNLPVGGTWTSNYTQTTTFTEPAIPVITMNSVINGTVMEVGSEVTIGDTTYTDVIKTKLVQNVTMAGQTTVATSYYWFAKDIGPIRTLIEYDPVDYNSELMSYILN